MGLFGLFGKKSDRKPADAAPAPEKNGLAFCAGMRVEVSDAARGLLFVGVLQSMKGDRAELREQAVLTETAADAGPLPVRLRGYHSRDGKVVVLDGSIVRGPDGVWLAENLTLRKTGNDRSFFRLELNQDATVAHTAHGKAEPCKVRNVSVGGVCIALKTAFRMGDQLLLNVRILPEKDPLAAFCRVLRITRLENGCVEYGCCFLDLSEAEQERVTQMIFELQRRKKSRD